jgi:hypothetical protein
MACGIFIFGGVPVGGVPVNRKQDESAVKRHSVERGLELIRTLPEVLPDQADSRTLIIYEETQQTLRIPFVNFTFRTLANYPDFLESGWAYVRPIAQTIAFERAADQLREIALLSDAPSALSTPWPTSQVRDFTATIHYVLPKLLLISTILEQALTRPDEAELTGSPSKAEDELSYGVAEGTLRLGMTDTKQISPRLQDIFGRIRRAHGHPEVASYFRVLANWSDFLEAAWDMIEPLIGSDSFERCKEAILRASWNLAIDLRGRSGNAELRQHVRRAASEKEDDIISILKGFRSGLDPDLLIDVTLIRAGLLGRDEAALSSFSAARIGVIGGNAAP